jgi:L,D-transpeptidase catalytic domain
MRTKPKKAKTKHTHLIASTFVFVIAFSAGVRLFMHPPLVTQGETIAEKSHVATSTPHAQGKHVVIYLNTMTLELRNGNTRIETLPLLSQGKPGSYYETIGGNYANDYKEPLHFSSIGHVYMPYSIHLFGNYFIHGVPYYPDGREVSSAFSGGCIRLTNDNAKKVYDFVDRGTLITVTRDTETRFAPTNKSLPTLTSTEMTNLMVTSLSLELLTQDNIITDTDGITPTTRRALLPRLLISGDTAISHLYAKSVGENAFIDAMNQKAQALGLTNTHFTSVEIPVVTTYEDHERMMMYVTNYKSYLRGVQDGR